MGTVRACPNLACCHLKTTNSRSLSSADSRWMVHSQQIADIRALRWRSRLLLTFCTAGSFDTTQKTPSGLTAIGSSFRPATHRSCNTRCCICLEQPRKQMTFGNFVNGVLPLRATLKLVTHPGLRSQPVRSDRDLRTRLAWRSLNGYSERHSGQTRSATTPG